MKWKLIDGYRWPYRVSDEGIVERQLDSGRWRRLQPYIAKGRAKVSFQTKDKKQKHIPLARMVAVAFMGGIPPGKVVCLKNGMKMDCAVENIVFKSKTEAPKMGRPGNSAPVAKVDRNGEVVAIYPSQSEAARKNHISQAAIGKRCQGLIEDPYRLDGFNYIFADNLGRKKPGRKRKE